MGRLCPVPKLRIRVNSVAPRNLTRVRAWLNSLPGFEKTGVDAVDPLTDGISNVTCRLSLTNSPVASAVLRVQPKERIFEPYDVMREAAVLRCLSGTSVPVPGVLATDSDSSFFGAPCLLMEWADAPHMPAPEVDPAGFAADLSPFAQALAAIHALDWRRRASPSLASPILRVPASPRRSTSFNTGCELSDATTTPCWSALIPFCVHLPLQEGAWPCAMGIPTRSTTSSATGRWSPWSTGNRLASAIQGRMLPSSLPCLICGGRCPSAPCGRTCSFGCNEEAAGEMLEGLDLFRAFWVFQLGVVYHG
jgi:Phosphotransferase enzyme family